MMCWIVTLTWTFERNKHWISDQAWGSPMHSGSSPDHSPLSWHMRSSSPTRTKPLSHSYVAVDPKVTPVSVTLPLVGFCRVGHSISVYRWGKNKDKRQNLLWCSLQCNLIPRLESGHEATINAEQRERDVEVKRLGCSLQLLMQIPSQVGALKLQLPSTVHTLLSTPTRVNPILQVYKAGVPSVVPEERSIWPLSGGGRGPQSTAAVETVSVLSWKILLIKLFSYARMLVLSQTMFLNPDMSLFLLLSKCILGCMCKLLWSQPIFHSRLPGHFPDLATVDNSQQLWMFGKGQMALNRMEGKLIH